MKNSDLNEKRRLLEYAIALDWVKEVKELIKTGVDLNGAILDRACLNTKNQRKKITFHEGYIDRLIKESYLNVSDYEWRWTPLTLALHLGHLKIADQLLEKGADPIEPLIFSKEEIQPPLFFLMNVDDNKSTPTSLKLQKKIFDTIIHHNNDIRQGAHNRELYAVNVLFWNGNFEKLEWVAPYLNVPHFSNALVSKIFTYFLQNSSVILNEEKSQHILQTLLHYEIEFTPDDIASLKCISNLNFESLQEKHILEKKLEKAKESQSKNKIRL